MHYMSVDDLLDALREYQLLEADQLKEIERELAHRFPEPSALLHELKGRGWLTSYQVEQLTAGKAAALVLGQYLLLELLGEGGMGQVFKARHRLMERVVALKIIRRDQLNTPLAVERFQREIKAVAKLSHPNIVIAHDANQVGHTHFFVMEFVEGVDLGRLVRERGPLPVGLACEYIRQAALGLQHAHEKGLVHRDIKPSNLLLTLPTGAGSESDGMVKILDMGLARVRQGPGDSDTPPSLTQPGAVMGTPDFMAPEQARDSHTVDIRADLYSLGCTLFYLLTGRMVFPADTLTEKLYKHWFEEPPLVDHYRPEVPTAVSAVIQKLLAKDPANRFQTPAELAEALAPHARPATSVSTASGGTIWNRLDERGPQQAPSVPTSLPPEAITPPTHIPSEPTPRGPAFTDPDDVPTAAGLRWSAVAVETHDTQKAAGSAAPVVAATTEVPAAALAARSAAPSAPPTASRLLLKVTAVLMGLAVAGGVSLWWSGRNRDPADTPPTRNEVVAVVTRKDTDNGKLKPTAKVVDPPKKEDPVIPPPPRGPDRYALLIGVTNNERRELKPMPYAGADMDQLAEALRQAGGIKVDNIVLLTQRPGVEESQLPRAANIRRELTRLTKRMTRQDSLMVAVACPGVQFKGTSETFLCPADARLANRQTLVPLSEFYHALRDCAAGFKLLLVDACRKEVLADNAPPGIELEDVPCPQREAPPDGVAVFFSCSSGEVGYDRPDRLKGDPIKNGVFFHWFSKALRERKEDAEEFTRTEVFADVRRHYRPRARQTPERLGTTQGPIPLPGLASFANVERVGELAVLEGHTAAVTGTAFTPDGRRAVTSGQDEAAFVWELASGKPDQLETSILCLIWGVAVTSNGELAVLACGGNLDDDRVKPGMRFHNTVRVMNLATRKEDRVLSPGFKDDKEASGAYFTSVAVSPDGQLVLAGCDDRYVRLWSITGKLLFRFQGHTGRVKCVAFSPDGTRALSGGEDGLRLWDVPNKQFIALLSGHTKTVRGVAFSPDGKQAISAGEDNTIRLWDLETRTEVRCFEEKHEGGVWAVAFSPDGRRALSGGPDRSVRLWDVASGKQVYPFRGHTRAVTSVAFSPDGRRALSGSQDNTVRLWGLPRP